ncbi:MAG: NAD-dependent epimerase/dehydratase family protein [Bryobacteraceae bacterium]
MHRHRQTGSIVITGGAGFLGCCLAERLLDAGAHVVLIDHLTTVAAAVRFSALDAKHERRLTLIHGDIRRDSVLERALPNARLVFHLAGQSSPQRSIAWPKEDFDLNARATGHLVAQTLALSDPPTLVFASCRHVYGTVTDIATRHTNDRLEPFDPTIRHFGIGEAHPIEFATPLACSKLAAERHVQWAATCGAPSVVLRLGSVYGPGGDGGDETNCLSQFASQILASEPITVHGDGPQVRDWLHVDDAVDALLAAAGNADALSGAVWNAGGGPRNAASELEIVSLLDPSGAAEVQFTERPACDPDFMVFDNRRFSHVTNWRPRTSLSDGIATVREWLASEDAESRWLKSEAAAI